MVAFIHIKPLYISTVTAAIITAISAHFLYQYKADINDRIVLAMALALFGIIDKLLIEALQARKLRFLLREDLDSFFEKLERRDRNPPLWEDLLSQISKLRNIESSSKYRKLLIDAISEVKALRNHQSFTALNETDVERLRKLNNKL